MNDADLPQGLWASGQLPSNVRIGANSIITGPKAFQRFRSLQVDALVIGDNCTLDGVHFAINPSGRANIGHACAFFGSLLLSELELVFGDHVFMGFNAIVSDSDFHPSEPAERHLDVLACSMIGEGLPRRPYVSKPIIVGDNVFIGHNATILKGVTIGTGAVIEPGTVVTRDVPARARLLGNPAQIIGYV